MGFYLKLKTCCCGCSLELGTLILLWFHLILAVLSIASPKYSMGLASLVEMGISISGLYAVYAKKPAFLLPEIVLLTILLVLLLGTFVLVIIIFVIAIFAFNYFIHQFEDSLNASSSKHSPFEGPAKSSLTALGPLMLLWFIPVFLLLLIACLVLWYLVSVVFSYYKQLEEEVNNPPESQITE